MLVKTYQEMILKNLMDIYLFMDYVIKNIDVMNEYDVD